MSNNYIQADVCFHLICTSLKKYVIEIKILFYITLLIYVCAGTYKYVD